MKKFLAITLALTMMLSVTASAASFWDYFGSLFGGSSSTSTSVTTTASNSKTTTSSAKTTTSSSKTTTASQTTTSTTKTNYNKAITPAKTYKPSISVPAYSGKAYVAVNGNKPFFKETEKTTVAFEYYGALDSLKRCTYTFACVGKEIMPTTKRGSLSHKPTGWVQNQYDFVESKNLYNRCHLIAWQLTGENNNKQNLITGTRYMNVQGMIPFEDMVADYVKETGNHVMYRVTPIFSGNNLLASGVLIEGWSVEDYGDGICFNVYAYNVQPGVKIDYATGKNSADTSATTTSKPTTEAEKTFVINKNGYKVHLPTCGSAKNMSTKNRLEFTGTVSELLAKYPKAVSAGCCHPY